MFWSRLKTTNYHKSNVPRELNEKKIQNLMYFGPCQTSIMSMIWKDFNRLYSVTVFAKKTHDRCFTKPEIGL